MGKNDLHSDSSLQFEVELLSLHKKQKSRVSGELMRGLGGFD